MGGLLTRDQVATRGSEYCLINTLPTYFNIYDLHLPLYSDDVLHQGVGFQIDMDWFEVCFEYLLRH